MKDVNLEYCPSPVKSYKTIFFADCSVLIPAVPSGQVLIPSGKFEKPSKVSGKSNFKDEVVIRNADSGKGKTISHFNLYRGRF